MAKLNKAFIVTQDDLTSQLSGVPSQLNAPPQYNTSNDTIDTDIPQRAVSGKNKGLPIGEERFSFILLSEQYEKIQAMAYWERQTLKDTVIEIFNKAIDDYERKNGTLRPKPKKSK